MVVSPVVADWYSLIAFLLPHTRFSRLQINKYGARPVLTTTVCLYVQYFDCMDMGLITSTLVFTCRSCSQVSPLPLVYLIKP